MGYGQYAGNLLMTVPHVAGTYYPTGTGGDGTDQGTTASGAQSSSVFVDPNDALLDNGRKAMIWYVTCDGPAAATITLEGHNGGTWSFEILPQLLSETLQICLPIYTGFRVVTTGVTTTVNIIYSIGG